MALGLALGAGIAVVFVQSWFGYQPNFIAYLTGSRSQQAPPVSATAKRLAVQGAPSHGGGLPAAETATAPGLDATEQIAAYLDGLKSGKYRVDEFEESAEVARRLGCTSKVFESVYRELTFYVRLHMKRDGHVPPDAITGRLSEILQGEQAIKDLINRRDPRTIAAITYLRALQHGKASFPNPNVRKPPGSEILQGLASAYPSARIEQNDPFFIAVYDRTFDFVDKQMQQIGLASIHDIIGELRRSIVQRSLALDQPSQGEGRRLEEQYVRAALKQEAQHLRNQHYEAVGVDAVELLPAGATKRFPLQLNAAKSYALIAACDMECKHVAVSLRNDQAQLLLHSPETLPTVILAGTPDRTGTYSLEVAAPGCSAQACFVGIFLLVKPTAPN